ncbi:TetR/AcrR family transcriptional regulator [Clostridium sp. DJ247]|uniref:TetR/AcrR family transcriptional regulator n=1 Tax=Clostridium sp. DJ247 TaxID=2726188 RepID=UPI00162712E8|nr:TetR/AcrR family transcriptional regulator [Clostridium sp. DJ247]MBC2579794.1 TetR/AcrR family transcriptional regulator [Clostridium sp. DJ247]
MKPDNENQNNKDSIEKLFLSEDVSEEEMTKRQWRILEAATKVFAEKGFDGSRTSEIAKEAEVAEGTIFRYYKTKKHILMGLLIPLITKFLRPLVIKSAESIVKNKENKPIDEVIKNLYIDRLHLVEKNSSLIKTVFVESLYHPELLETIRNNIAPKLFPFINSFVEENIEKKTFRNLEPALITRTMLSLLLGYIILTNAFPDHLKVGGDDEEEIKKIVDVLLNGVLNHEN